MQAENARSQLQRIMERFDIDIVSTCDERMLWEDVRKVLACGFFMQVAHKEGEKNTYLTVKDNQASIFTLIGGDELDNVGAQVGGQDEWWLRELGT